MQHFVIGGAKEMLITHQQHAICGALLLQRYRQHPLAVFRFFQGRMDCAIRENEAIDAELAVIDFIAKIAAVGPEMLPVFIPLAEPLIHPIPNKAALQARVLTKRIPIVIKAAQTVPHSMGVFT